jgi:hypothetical protein
MKKCSALVLLACAFALLTAERVAAAPVTWDFIATSCSGPAQTLSAGGCEPSPHYPLVLATLTLTGPDSSGAASTGLFPTSGDPFAFDLVAAQGLGTGRSMVSTADPTEPNIAPSGAAPAYWVVSYAISWTEVAGQLTAVGIDFLTIQDELDIGLTGGRVGSDFQIAGCGDMTVCQINGFGRW